MTLPSQRDFGQNLAIFGHLLAFSVTILVVTAINMLTMGIRRICIILRHIQSWFEVVLALAIFNHVCRGVQKALFGPKMTKHGRVAVVPKWSTRVQNDPK